MIVIKWKGKIGYGDIVSPLCYAHNISHKLKVEVDLQFQWPHGRDHKYTNADPETLWERADALAAECAKADTAVSVSHNFNNPVKYNHTNYDWDVVGRDVFHNYWYPTVKNNCSTNTIVVNSTENNIQSLGAYGRAWKDPVAKEWGLIREVLSERYNVVMVNYRTPIHELILTLRSAVGFIGYHGTAAWVAKFMHTPSIIFADGGKLTRCAFPYAFIDRGNEPLFVLRRMVKIFDDMRMATSNFENKYLTYIPSEKFQQHLCYE